MSLKGLLVDTCLTLLAACLVTEDIRYLADIILNTDKLWKKITDLENIKNTEQYDLRHCYFVETRQFCGARLAATKFDLLSSLSFLNKNSDTTNQPAYIQC